MSKKTWLLVGVITVIILYLVASRVNPDLDVWLNNAIVTPVSEGLSGAVTSITQTEMWQLYVAPNAWVISGVACFFGGILIYRWIRQQKLPWQKQVTQEAYQHQPQPSPQEIHVHMPASESTKEEEEKTEVVTPEAST